jgi:TM2 domain-containing membrane protein YozV
MSDKKFLPALLLAIFLGAFGAHRFYVGKTGTAVIQLLTCGGATIWALVDIIMIAMGTFRDKNGLPLARE